MKCTSENAEKTSLSWRPFGCRRQSGAELIELTIAELDFGMDNFGSCSIKYNGFLGEHRSGLSQVPVH